ncbi:hypothetical protein [Streptomyces sp. NPDC002054]|uniref:hypothetical protein n=1 Tax=Streptomyces sp. NPDC002054 TaxID=3154663 RepID=UPI003324AC3D
MKLSESLSIRMTPRSIERAYRHDDQVEVRRQEGHVRVHVLFVQLVQAEVERLLHWFRSVAADQVGSEADSLPES